MCRGTLQFQICSSSFFNLGGQNILLKCNIFARTENSAGLKLFPFNRRHLRPQLHKVIPITTTSLVFQANSQKVGKQPE